ncbi:MAG: hypothetical protein ACKVW3_05475 [Phycisphaerales bacterium]
MAITKSPHRAVIAGASRTDNDKRRVPPPDSWASLRRTLHTWEQPQLLGLVHALFTTVPEARAAIVGRLTLNKPATAKKGTLDRLRKQVRRAVWPTKRMWKGDPDMRAARRVGDQYLRATSDADGAIALYVEMVEAAMELSFEFGWDDDGFYDSIWRVAQAADKQLPQACDAMLLNELAVRVRSLLEHKNFPGWGMDEVLHALAERLEQQAQTLAARNAP